ncbi:MAG: hypothetical protein AAF541_18155 [Pseudomonadota bacterium]
MRKLYMIVAAAAALLISQIGHAIPAIPGSTDTATNDGQTYYALFGNDSGWFVRGYDAAGVSTGFQAQLGPNEFLTPAQQDLVGLAFDGTTFYALRNDATSSLVGTDTWSVVGFGLDGQWDGNQAMTLGPSPFVVPSQQTYVGFSYMDEGFRALRDDTLLDDSYRSIGFDQNTGAWDGFAQVVGQPSISPLDTIASFNQSPGVSEVTFANAKVPAPGAGLLLGAILALGALRRKVKAA